GYFGPYSHAWAIRDAVDTLLRVFPVRPCSAGVFKRAGQIGRPCLLGYIGKCSAPCVGRISADEHRQLAEEFCDFVAGQTGKFTRRLEAQMLEASQAEEFERAARLRDDLQALQRALEKQAVVLPDGTNCDVIGLGGDQLRLRSRSFTCATAGSGDKGVGWWTRSRNCLPASSSRTSSFRCTVTTPPRRKILARRRAARLSGMPGGRAPTGAPKPTGRLCRVRSSFLFCRPMPT